MHLQFASRPQETSQKIALKIGSCLSKAKGALYNCVQQSSVSWTSPRVNITSITYIKYNILEESTRVVQENKENKQHF